MAHFVIAYQPELDAEIVLEEVYAKSKLSALEAVFEEYAGEFESPAELMDYLWEHQDISVNIIRIGGETSHSQDGSPGINVYQ